MTTKEKHSAKPSAAAVSEALARVQALYHQYGEEAEDIAQEAVTRALATFDPSRGGLFTAFALSVARNVAREHARRARRARGETEEKALPAAWEGVFARLEPRRFELWFVGTASSAALEADTLSAVEYVSRSLLAFARTEADDHDGDWTPIHWAIVDKACAELAGHSVSTTEELVWTVLRAAGIKGGGLDRWFATVRARARDDLKHGARAAQVVTLWAFLCSRCRVDQHASVAASKLRSAYENLCRQRGESAIPAADFGRLLASLPGVELRRSRLARVYQGLELLPGPTPGVSRTKG